jgi:hypothetical protein
MRYLILLSFILTSCVFKNVDVKIDELGVVDDKVLKPGRHLIRKNKSVSIYDIKEKVYGDSLTFLTKDGQEHTASFTAKFRIPEMYVVKVHNSFGQHYLDISVIPEARASIRRCFLKMTSDSLLFVSKDSIESRIVKDLFDVLIAHGLALTHFQLDKLIYQPELKIVTKFNLESEYRILRTSKNWDEKKKAIDKFLKTNSKETLEIILRTYNDDKDERTRDYILDHVKSSYR